MEQRLFQDDPIIQLGLAEIDLELLKITKKPFKSMLS